MDTKREGNGSNPGGVKYFFTRLSFESNSSNEKRVEEWERKIIHFVYAALLREGEISSYEKKFVANEFLSRMTFSKQFIWYSIVSVRSVRLLYAYK